MKAFAAASVFQVTTGSGVTPGIWRQIGKPSDFETMAYMQAPRRGIYPMWPSGNKEIPRGGPDCSLRARGVKCVTAGHGVPHPALALGDEPPARGIFRGDGK